jgi:hypothetical protein
MEILATQLLIAMGLMGIVGLITYLIEYLKNK